MFTASKLLILVGILALLVSCSAKHEEPEEAKGMSYRAGELLVRQCQDISDYELSEIFKEHDVSIKKQVSPHLYVVTWADDDKGAEQVAHELKSTHKLCGVDKNPEQ
ncbi:MAG: hypothetical protein R8M46_00405 [Ghiorsea sp.]